jgi:hypothetical protein
MKIAIYIKRGCIVLTHPLFLQSFADRSAITIIIVLRECPQQIFNTSSNTAIKIL